MLRPLALSIALLTGTAALPVAAAEPAGAQTDGPSDGVVYSARRGPAEVRLVGLGKTAGGDELLLIDVSVECGGFRPQARLVGVVEEDGRFEVEGPVSDSGTTDVITGDFDDIDGKVRSDGALLEIDIEVEGADNAGPTGRCEETQPWRLEPRPSSGAARIDGAVPTDATRLASNGDALFTLGDGELARVDPQTLQTTWTVDVSARATEVAAAGNAVWVLDSDRLELTRIDALSGDELAPVPLEAPERADAIGAVLPEMTASETTVWVAVNEVPALYQVDTATNAVTPGLSPGSISALAAVPDGVYVGLSGEGMLLPVLADGVVVVSTPAEALAASSPSAWARTENVVTSLRQEASLVVPFGDVTVGASPVGGASIVAAAPGAWTATERGLAIVDGESTRAGSVPIVGSAATGLAFAEDAVFVIDAGHLIRIEAS